RASSGGFSCRIPDGVRTGASTERTRGSSRHSSSTPLPIMPVAPKMTTFTALAPHSAWLGIGSRSAGAARGPVRRRRGLPRALLRGQLRAQPVLLLAELRRERLAEVVRLEARADLDLGIHAHGIGAALDPLDRLVHRPHLPQPEAGDQLLGLRERPVDHLALAAGEPD